VDIHNLHRLPLGLANAKLRARQHAIKAHAEAPDGYRITPYNPDFERQMTLARRVMRHRRDALRELAK